ncbi:MAG: DUF2203 domain-containing protein [Candidatus Diapherotrites archaeon]|nr:DUF2203 domain-containing protein [Candidatus Diapherotrites archaeon]
MQEEKTYYSLEDARKLIPFVGKKLRRLQKLNAEISVMNAFHINFKGDSIENRLKAIELNKNYHKAMHAFYSGLEDITSKGLVIKDFDQGLVDFYSKMDGQDIFLCWKLGEKTIDHWHTVETGYSSRQPVRILREQYEKKLKELL